MAKKMTRRSALTCGLAAAVAPGLAQAGAVRTIPTLFEENIIFAVPVTTDGKPLKLLTDTGGGTFLLSSAVERLGLSGTTGTVMDGDQQMIVAPLPGFKPAGWIPAPIQGDGRMPVFPAEGEGRSMADRGWDGMLGQAWFGDRIWTLDYPGRSLTLHETVPPLAARVHETLLGFQTREGRRSSHFPRIQAEVDGEVLDLLFDTGAQSGLTPAAVQAMGDGTADFRASSFISRTVFDGWRSRHPDWPVIAQGEARTGMDLIRVANLRVAGFDTGPVWFAARPDRNFTEWMSQWMDRTIVGALRGSALRHFRITLDYPGSKAWFEAP